MLKIKNGRIYKDNVSFALPEGLGINTSSDRIPEDGMVFISSENDYILVIEFKNGSITPYQDLSEEIMGEDGYKVHSEIRPIQRFGLNGYCCFYGGDVYHYYEEQFETTITEDNNSRLSIYIETKNQDIESIVKLPEVQAFWEGIKVE